MSEWVLVAPVILWRGLVATECWGQIPPLCCPRASAREHEINKSNEPCNAGLFIKSIKDGHAYYCTSGLCQALFVHTFSLAIPTKVACLTIAINPEPSYLGIELLRERLGKAAK